jgi:hypothetical protein
MDIDPEILKNTTHCKKYFECLLDKNNSSCLKVHVTHCVGAKVLFVKCANHLCRYNMNYGTKIICHCPTRLEIYKKHRR